MAKKKESAEINFNNMDEVNTLIQKLVKEMIASNTLNQEAMQNNPLVYGFNIRVDRNGISLIEKDEKEPQSNKLEESREPLVDIIDKDDYIVIMAEVPGVDKANIKLVLEKGKLNIAASGTSRNYNRDVILSADIDMPYSHAIYNNGVLEINLKKGYYKGNDNKIRIL
ncbi:MAG: Hsp20/alpha crystallin family protein [Candidatus Micrarchaeaceae archaeon]|jgi:HSP20 family protein